MSTLDFILLLILGGFVLSGLWFGFLKKLSAIIGTLAGLFVSIRYGDAVAEWFIKSFGGNVWIVKAIAFLVVYAVVARLIGLAFALLDKIFRIIVKIPLFGFINRLIGAAFGFLEGAIVIGVTLLYVTTLPIPSNISQSILASPIASWFITIGKILLPFFPESIRKLII